jgi:hypothetical protein
LGVGWPESASHQGQGFLSLTVHQDQFQGPSSHLKNGNWGALFSLQEKWMEQITYLNLMSRHTVCRILSSFLLYTFMMWCLGTPPTLSTPHITPTLRSHKWLLALMFFKQKSVTKFFKINFDVLTLKHNMQYLIRHLTMFSSVYIWHSLSW